MSASSIHRSARRRHRHARPAVVRPAGVRPVEPCEARVLMSTNVYTWHNDTSRTGANLTETQLTPTNVATAGAFGVQHTLPVDGQIYAQPLYVHGVKVNGATHNVVYVATEHDSVYAFDSDTGQQLWNREYTNLPAGISTQTSTDVGVTDISPEIGITGTPAIDHATGTMYFVTKEKTTAPDGTVTFSQHFRAIDIATGTDQFGGGTLIQESLPGNGTGYTGPDNSMVPFDPLHENQRPGLLLSHGEVYVGYSSHGDIDPYHGWLFAFNTRSLGIDAAIDTSPDGLRAPIWMGGAAPAADAAGNIFVATGNGTFDAPLGGFNYADSVLRIDKVKGYKGEGADGLAIKDYFTPYNEVALNQNDKDLGSGGVVLVPGTHEAITGGKDGHLYVLNTHKLGKFNLAGNTQIIQDDATATGGTPIRDTPAYHNGAIYVAGLGGHLVGYKLVGGKISDTPIGTSAEIYGNPGATPSVSANGSRNGIVWAVQRVLPDSANPGSGDPAGHVVLNAYDAASLKLLYTSQADPTAGDATPPAIKFSTPTIADGHVFVGTTNALLVYGLTPKVTAVQLYSTRTNIFIGTVTDGGTLDLSHVRGPVALAVTLNTPIVGSVRYKFAGGTVTQNLPGYRLYDNGYTHAGVFATGKHTITADAFDFANAAGFQGVGSSLTFTVA